MAKCVFYFTNYPARYSCYGKVYSQFHGHIFILVNNMCLLLGVIYV
jgi:hypothetical protein